MQATIKVLATLRGKLAENELERRVLQAQADILEREFLARLAEYNPLSASGLTADEQALARVSKIGAIKMVRDRCKLGLKESKDKVDEFLAVEQKMQAARTGDQAPYSPSTWFGCGDPECGCAQ